MAPAILRQPLFLLQAHDVIRNHVEQRRIDRIQDPARFDITPTLAERAVRRVPPQSSAYEESVEFQVIIIISANCRFELSLINQMLHTELGIENLTGKDARQNQR